MQPNLIADYEQRVTSAKAQTAKQEKQTNTYSLLRLGVFILFLIVIYVSVDMQSIVLFLAATVILALAFNWLIRQQNKFEAAKKYYQNYDAVNQNEVTIAQTRANIYDNGTSFVNEKHYYTADLDIFGQASLFQLVNRAATPAGRQVLASWFDAPSSKPNILLRQQAIRELAQKHEWRLNLQANLLFALKQDAQQLPNLLAYLKMPVVLTGEKWLKIYGRVVPFLSITLVIAAAFFVEARYALALLLAFNNRLTSSKSEMIDKADLIAGRIGDGLKGYANVFKDIETEEFDSELCRELAQKIKQQQGKPVSYQINRLSQLINRLNQRLNMVMNFLLNAFLISNIRQVINIEEWKRANHQNLEVAFESIAGFEALISLAALHYNNPEWAIPQIAEGEGFTMNAQTIAHPLINERLRVANSYELNNTRKIDIITGSNMAGKSTFLRTLGINTVLALAGAPVCAQSMQVSVVQLFSYMRIKDSLNESTSTFKAELDRLQMLLKAVAEQPNIFFLVDEMLRGTNSVDKYLGSKAVIERLISQQGVGLVATHDLQLAELEKQYPNYVRNFYFDIQVVNGEMLFDYKIKPGECKTFNASLLLEQIGIYSSNPLTP
jgi:DNA mismatch repair ATPase MutS